MTFHQFKYKVKDINSRNFQILKNDPERSVIFTDNPPISFRRNKNIRDNLVRSALRNNLPAPAGTFSCSRTRWYTCSFRVRIESIGTSTVSQQFLATPDRHHQTIKGTDPEPRRVRCGTTHSKH